MSQTYLSESPPVIDIRRLTRQFGATKALDDVSLTIPRGGVFGLIGGNGAGKTTIWAAAMVWAAATVLSVIRWPLLIDSRAVGIVLIVGIASLIVTPLAAAPLALSANRHR